MRENSQQQRLFDPDFLGVDEATATFRWLQTNIAWKQETIFGRPAPRLNAWYAELGINYRYSGITHYGEGWLPELQAINNWVGSVAGVVFNSILLNRYRDGQDSMSFHTDAEKELGINPVVATLSFGAEREFKLRHPASKERLSYRLTHGSLLVMAGTSQHHWLHAIPKTKDVVGERISLTFRRILSAPVEQTKLNSE